ncbi:MAG: chemotaxis response regulator protein-glutamate methylesterase [Desulfobacterales bacterium]|nr:chemotaxis response regulator protein-glutamate methylesterase [Desulfobacterales bacterium]
MIPVFQHSNCERSELSSKSIRVLVVDDTVVYRKIVADVLDELPGVEVVGAASNGKVAMSKIASLKPDLLILDLEMPKMHGLEVLARMRVEWPDVGAIILSTLTQQGGETTIRALELGAFDFIPKPQTDSMAENRQGISNSLDSMIKAFARRHEIRHILKGKSSPARANSAKKIMPDSAGVVRRTRATARQKKTKSKIVGIGISTGGPHALAQMIPQLPADLAVPVLIVQHMPHLFTKALANSLDSRCALEVKEAVDGETARPNVALIAPGGKQMKVVAGADGKATVIRITDDPPEKSCKPSVDYLFRSIAYHYAGRATGVIMTGMGSDGTLGSKLMKRNGATIIAQDKATSVVYGMPKEAIDAGIVDVIAPLDKIADEIVRTVKIAP